VAPEGVGPSYLVGGGGGGWSVLAPSANHVPRMPHTTSSCIDLYKKNRPIRKIICSSVMEGL
jgi:hypothetical protein